MQSERPSPARLRAQIARVDADLAAARLRLESLGQELEMAPYVAGCRQPATIKVRIADVEATVAELEATREELARAPANDTPPAPVPVPVPAAANDAAPASPEYVGTREAAALLGISTDTLERLRTRPDGPPFKRIGRRVVYSLAGLRDYGVRK